MPADTDPAIVLDESGDDRLVRWRHDGRVIEVAFDRPPRSVVVWADRVLVVEALDTEPGTPTDNAVVFAADGAASVRLRPPRDLVAEPSWMIGFHLAHLDAEGEPILVVATRAGDFWGRPDVATGGLVDVRTWR